MPFQAAEEAAIAEEPAEPVISEDIKLLTEIRDQLKDLNKGKIDSNLNPLELVFHEFKGLGPFA